MAAQRTPGHSMHSRPFGVPWLLGSFLIFRCLLAAQTTLATVELQEAPSGQEGAEHRVRRSVRKAISRSKFTEQIFSTAAGQNFRMHRYKTFPLMHMRKQMMNSYLPTYNTVYAKFFNRHESTLAGHACLRQCRWSAPAPTCSRLARP